MDGWGPTVQNIIYLPQIVGLFATLSGPISTFENTGKFFHAHPQKKVENY